MATTDADRQRELLLQGGREFFARWSAYLTDHELTPDLAEAMKSGVLPPSAIPSPSDEAQVRTWLASYPEAYEFYWTLRAMIEEYDLATGGTHRKRTGHIAAIYCIFEQFRSKADRARLGVPSTQEELCKLLGTNRKSLSIFRRRYREVFDSASAVVAQTMVTSFLPGALLAMGKTAGQVGREGTRDRELLFRMAWLFVERHDITTQGERLPASSPAEATAVVAYSQMDDATLAAIMANMAVIRGDEQG